MLLNLQVVLLALVSYALTFTTLHAYTYVHTYVRTYVCMYVCMYACMYIMYVMYVMYVRMYVCMYALYVRVKSVRPIRSSPTYVRPKALISTEAKKSPVKDVSNYLNDMQ